MGTPIWSINCQSLSTHQSHPFSWLQSLPTRGYGTGQTRYMEYVISTCFERIALIPTCVCHIVFKGMWSKVCGAQLRRWGKREAEDCIEARRRWSWIWLLKMLAAWLMKVDVQSCVSFLRKLLHTTSSILLVYVVLVNGPKRWER